MKKFLIAAAAAAIYDRCAYAQTATEFYVVQDTHEEMHHRGQEPTTTTAVVVGDGKVFRRARKLRPG